ncbi:MAG TPA: type II and III secretion system protein family protein [Vicinamibacterales bacterium]|nr:type II and III secretion system protein family protein [Vicinamibacterales bacterium]
MSIVTRNSRASVLALAAALIIPAGLLAAQAPAAQAPAPQAPAPQAPAAQNQPAGEFPKVNLTAGRSTVLATDFDITRVAVTNPVTADATVVAQREILIDGKTPGTISLIVWGANRREQYDIVVEQPIPALEQQLHQLFPGETIQVAVNGDVIILSGRVSNTEVMLRAAEVARAASAKANVINMIQVPGAAESQQVMLQVRFAEVNRRAITELGVNFFTGTTGFKNWVGRSTTGQFSAPQFDQDTLTFSDFLNIFLFNTKYNVGALIRALQQTGFFQSLAEPNLIAYNNQEASFLAGGEFPVPVVSGNTGNVSVDYKEFGVRLNFKPTIAGDLIRLRVAPEVSSLDFNNGVLLSGFRIPALTTRKAETEVELRDGQSFAIAGLIDNESQTDRAAIPFLSQLPIVGNLFKSKAERQERTELLVVVTPRLVRPLNPDEVPPLPTLPGRFLPSGDNIGEQFEGGGGTVDGPAAAPATARR